MAKTSMKIKQQRAPKFSTSFKKIRNLQNLLPRVSLQGSDPRR